MKPIKIKPQSRLRGTVTLPGDKSISHRAVILASIVKGRTVIKNFLFSDDCLITLKALRCLGVNIKIQKNKKEIIVDSKGKFCPPRSVLNMGESGTSARILLGLLAARGFKAKLSGASSLMKRPMARVIAPLRLMGADIKARNRGGEEFLPIRISGKQLHSITWRQKINSAQVKSAILLAALNAEGKTAVIEPVASRDHTERMIKLFGGRINIKKSKITISESILRTPGKVFIPGDISSAAFFIVAAILIRGSKLLLRNVGVNSTRFGALRVLKRMGAKIRIINKRGGYEPIADIRVSSCNLRSTVIKHTEIPSLIDELPVIMVAASLAKGKTVIRGVKELRVKETDRIRSMRLNLMKLGVNIRVKALKKFETIEIIGDKQLTGSKLNSHGDHRTAMSMIVAALAAKGDSTLDDFSCISKSFPGFLSEIRHLSGK